MSEWRVKGTLADNYFQERDHLDEDGIRHVRPMPEPQPISEARLRSAYWTREEMRTSLEIADRLAYLSQFIVEVDAQGQERTTYHPFGYHGYGSS